MARPKHLVPLKLTKVSASTSRQRRDDGEEFRLRRQIDQRLADLRLERSLREVWQT